MEVTIVCIFLLLFPSFGNNANNTEPSFSWIDSQHLHVQFDEADEDIVYLHPTQPFGDTFVPCLYEGTLKSEKSGSVTVSGCQDDSIVHIVIYSERLPGRHMYDLRNGSTDEISWVYGGRINEDKEGRRKREIFEDYVEYEYDDVDFSGGLADVPPKLALNVRLGYEESLLAHLGSHELARQYVLRVFTLGKRHFQHFSLGTQIRLDAILPIKFVPNEWWKPLIPSLSKAKAHKEKEPVPTTFFCFTDDTNSYMGAAYTRKGCDILKGIAITKWRSNIQLAAQTYVHENGHLLGAQHDEIEDRNSLGGTACTGTGVMTDNIDPNQRPSTWSDCSKRRFQKWFYSAQHDYGDCLTVENPALVCGVADLHEDGNEHMKPLTCDHLGGPPPLQPEKQEVPADKFPWIGILSNSASKQKICLGVIISQDLIVASKPCEALSSYTFEISHRNFISELTVAPPQPGTSSENDLLVFKLVRNLPLSIYRPACVPDQHFVPKAVKATESCEAQENTNTLLKVSLQNGNIVSSSSNILTDKECADNILLNENSDCWQNFDHNQYPCMTIDKTIQIQKRIEFKNYEDYTCHKGILQAAEKCRLHGIIGEPKCLGIDEAFCIGDLPHNYRGEFHKCRKEVSEYSKCITENFIEITGNDYSDFPFSGVNCLHSYLPKRPECAKHPRKRGLPSLGSKWSFNADKAFKMEMKKCNKQKTLELKQSCQRNKTLTYDWLRRKPYDLKWSMSMLKEILEVNSCIVSGTGCNVCSSSGGSVCIDQQVDSAETEFVFWYESCRERWFFLGPSTGQRRNKICSQTQITEIPFLEQNTQLIRDYARDNSAMKITILPVYPTPVIVMVGHTGVGKSTVGDALLMGHAGNKQCFKTSSGLSSQTKMTKYFKGKWLGVGHCVTVIETPGTTDIGGKQRDYENVMNIRNILKYEVKQIDVFMALFNGQVPRFSQGIQAALNTYEAIFGDTFWDHVVTEITHWKFVKNAIRDRYAQHCTELKSKCLIADEGSSGSGEEEYENTYTKWCKLMIEEEGSFSLNTPYETVDYSDGSVVNDDFWDNRCGWRDLPNENEYPTGWDQGSKDLYNKADFISRFIKADSWNEHYKEKMYVSKWIPSVFINPLWMNNKLGCERFQRETNTLWNTIEKMGPYSCTDKCEAPDSYFYGKPHIFGADIIDVDKSASTPGSPLQCSIWTGVEGAAKSIDVEWYHNDRILLQPSKYDMSLDSQAKHGQFIVHKLIFKRMDISYVGTYSCKVGGHFSNEVKVNMKL